MKKVAIIVTGNTRNLYEEWTKHSYPILSNLSGCESTFFFQLWDNDFIPDHLKSNQFVLENIAFETEVLSPEDITLSNEITMLSEQFIYNEIKELMSSDVSLQNSSYFQLFNKDGDELHDYAAYVDLCNYYCQPYAWGKTYENILNYEIKNSVKFDYVIKVRYDCFFRNSFKTVISDFEKINADLLHHSFSVWSNFKTPLDIRGGALPNGIDDQWMVIKKSKKTDVVLTNLFKRMFKTNHECILLHGRRYPFEQCFYLSLIMLNSIVATKHYDFFTMRGKSGFESTHKNFIKYGIVPRYTVAPPVIMNSALLEKIKSIHI